MRRIFSFEEGGNLRQYEGGYTDYALKKFSEKEETEAEQAKKNGNASKNDSKMSEKGQRTRGPQKLKFTYQEQKDYETIEHDIAALEKKLEELEAEMLRNATNSFKLTELTAKQDEVQKALEEKMDRWMYLEELAARIAEQ